MVDKIKNNIKKLTAVSIGHYFNDFYMSLIPPILFIFQRELGLTLTQQGIIAFVIMSIGAFIQPFAGNIIDKKGQPWLIILSISWIAFWMSISGLITNYYLLIFSVGIAAIASGLFHPLGSAISMKLGKKSRGTNLSIFIAAGSFATFTAPVVGLPLATKFGLKSLAFLMIPGFLVSLLIYLAGIQNITLEHKNDNQEINLTASLFHSKVIKWVSVLVFIGAVRTLSLYSLITYGIQYLSLKNINISTAGIIISLYLFFNALGVIYGGYISDKIGEKKSLVIFNLLATLATLILTSNSGPILILSFIILGFSLNGGNAANIILTHDLLPNNINMATGLITGLSTGLGGLGLLFFGKIADNYGLIIALTLLIIPLVLSELLSIILPKKMAL